MPVCAHLHVQSIGCPYCGNAIAVPFGEILFQWGYCPAHHPVPERAYDWGDHIRWRLDDEDRILPWVYFNGVDPGGGNIGDPQYSDVRVRAFMLGWKEFRCDACGVAGVDVEIEQGILTRAVAATSGSEISLIDQDGHSIPRPEWDDHPMSMCLVERRFTLELPGAGSSALQPELFDARFPRS